MPKDIPQETVELPEEEVTQPVEKMMEKPKTKRPRSEAQINNFNKLQEANKIRYEARMKANEELGLPKPVKKGTKNANELIIENKENYVDDVLTKKKQYAIKKKQKEVEIESSSDEEYIPPVKTKKKKKKPRIIIEDSSDSEQEIVISRRKRNKAVVVKEPVKEIMEKNIDGIEKEIEKEKTNKKKETPMKEFTHQQILKGMGL